MPWKIEPAAAAAAVATSVDATNARESHHLIPVATVPIYMWAKKIRVILLGRGVTDLTTAKVKNAFLPSLLAKCPAYLTEIIPTTTLEDAIKFLEAWDDVKADFTESFKDSPIDNKPSIQYYLNVQSFMQNMPPGISSAEHTNIAKSLAWGALKRSFPPDFRAFLSLLNVSTYPSEEDLRKLNDSWATYNKKSHVNAITHVLTQPAAPASGQSSSPDFVAPYEKLTKAISALTANVNRGFQRAQERPQLQQQNRQEFGARQNFNRPNNNRQNFGNQGYGNQGYGNRNQGFGNQGYGNQQRFQRDGQRPPPQPDACPGRFDYCYYHRRFGAEARQCDPANCTYVRPTDQPSTSKN